MLHDCTSAIDDLNQAILLNPGYADAYKIRAIARKSIGDADGAAADLKRSRQLPPADKIQYLVRFFGRRQYRPLPRHHGLIRSARTLAVRCDSPPLLLVLLRSLASIFSRNAPPTGPSRSPSESKAR